MGRWGLRAAMVAALSVALGAGCGSSKPKGAVDAGSDAKVSKDGGSDGNGWIDAGDGCGFGAELMYAISAAGELLKYDPSTNTLTDVGPINCTGTINQMPYSMTVNRDGTIWVAFTNGRLYFVNSLDASCGSTEFVPSQHDLTYLSLAFVSKEDDPTDQTLFAVGSDTFDAANGSSFATINPEALTVSVVGPASGMPALTGNAKGELWGFDALSTPPTVVRLNPATGDVSQSFDVAELGFEDDAGTGGFYAWAFAFWGGAYYLFWKDVADPSSSIWRFDPDTGDVTLVDDDIGHDIIGAGVSTCAPLVVY